MLNPTARPDVADIGPMAACSTTAGVPLCGRQAGLSNLLQAPLWAPSPELLLGDDADRAGAVTNDAH